MASQPSPRNSAISHSRVHKAPLLFSCAIFGAALIGVLHDDSIATFQKILGAETLGIPIRLFIASLLVVLFVPVPYAAAHAFRILLHKSESSQASGGIPMLAAILSMPEKYPELRRSRRVVVLTSAAYISLVIAWIIYATHKGI